MNLKFIVRIRIDTSRLQNKGSANIVVSELQYFNLYSRHVSIIPRNPSLEHDLEAR